MVRGGRINTISFTRQSIRVASKGPVPDMPRYCESVGRRLFVHDYATGILEKPENRMEIHETDGCGSSGIRGNWDGRGGYLSPVRNVQRVSS